MQAARDALQVLKKSTQALKDLERQLKKNLGYKEQDFKKASEYANQISQDAKQVFLNLEKALKDEEQAQESFDNASNMIAENDNQLSQTKENHDAEQTSTIGRDSVTEETNTDL